MTRNNNVRVLHLGDAIGPPGKTEEPYQLAAHAKRYAAIMDGGPLAWARSVHTMVRCGEMRPRKEPCDAAKIGTTLRPDLRAKAQAIVCRSENEHRLRSMIRAIRMLQASQDAADSKMAADIGKFLELTWGVRRAYESVSEGEVKVLDQLRDAWGEAQLPPADSTVNDWAADEMLIEAAVRGLK